MYENYKHEKNNVIHELQKFAKSFSLTFSESIWNYDESQLENSLRGVVTSDVIVGAMAANESADFFGGIGNHYDKNDQKIVRNYVGKNDFEVASDKLLVAYGKLIPFKFTLYNMENKGEEIGHLWLYSSEGFVLDKVKDEFILIIMIAVIKTLSLWMIMFFFINRLVAKPIAVLVRLSEFLNPKNDHFNLETSVIAESELISRKDELGILGRSTEMMRLELLNRDKTIQEYSRNLEEKVRIRTRDLMEKTNDLQAIFNHLPQGIFTLLEDGSIHHEYSQYLLEILETDDVSGKNIREVFLKKCRIGDDRKNQIMAALEVILGSSSDKIAWDFNEHHLPGQIVFSAKSGEKIIECDWEPVCNHSGTAITKILVVLRDVTEMHEMKKAFLVKEKEIQYMNMIIEVRSDRLHRYLDSMFSLIKDSRKYLSQRDVLARNIHTIKGNSRMYGMTLVSDLCHKMEEDISSSVAEEGLLLSALDNIEQEFHVVLSLVNKVSSSDGHSFDSGRISAFIDSCRTFFRSVAYSEEDELRTLIHQLSLKLDAINAISAHDFLERHIKGLDELSTSLGKVTPEVQIVDHNIRLKEDRLSFLHDVLVHLFRNSFDHGIESAEERQQKNKPARGKISIEFSHEGDCVQMVFVDDGRGLDLSELKKSAVRSGRIAESENDPYTIASQIFHSGLSTKNEVTDISGRGVGLDSVKEILKQNHCLTDLILNEQTGAQERHRVYFALMITLPEDYFLFPDHKTSSGT